ncbi:hypothetical protein ACFWIO_12230 [Streptomyces diastatochromogenes]|uniref:hypothetical protein n=1 Tax=Streptomyces diastatochromogenes TaxID=42236 RepID=UPI003664C242
MPRPRMAPVDEQSWESFSAPWNVDMKIAFEVGRTAPARTPAHSGSGSSPWSPRRLPAVTGKRLEAI